MARKLKNINVKFVSLVDKGANGKDIILKTAEDIGKSLKTIVLAKTDKVKKMVYGIVYAPGEEDSQGDFSTAEEIEKASQLFMKSMRIQNIDKQHNMEVQKAFVAENWIVRKGDEYFNEVGAWAVGIKIEDEELWKACESGEIGGLSLFGYAETEEDADLTATEKSLFRKMLEKAGLVKDFNSELYSKEINNLIWALQDTIWSLGQEDSSPEEKKAKVLENVAQFQIAVSNISKAGATISQANLDKLKSAIEALTQVANTAEKPKTEENDMKPEDVQKMIDASLEKQKETIEKANADRMTALENQINELKEIVTKSNSTNQDAPGSEISFV